MDISNSVVFSISRMVSK